MLAKTDVPPESQRPDNPAYRGSRAKRSRKGRSLEILSPRERDVVAGLVRGFTNKQIGILLGISHRTVEIHRARLMRKLDAASLSALLEIAFAQRDKLPDLDHAPASKLSVIKPPS